MGACMYERCPHCDSDAIENQHHLHPEYHIVVCTRCWAEGPAANDESEARSGWNAPGARITRTIREIIYRSQP